MLKSFKLFNLFSVDVKIHWSLLLVFLFVIDFTGPVSKMLLSSLTILMIYAFVLVHEFGHIFAARKYGVNTPTVVLSFLGGVALVDGDMEKLKPKQIMWIAFAGPLTNLIMFILFIGLGFFAFQDFEGGSIKALENMSVGQNLVLTGLVMNALMFVFNLLPIYPMDGGLFLRHMFEHFNIKKGFQISIIVTQIFCVALFWWSITFWSITGMIISVLFFLMSLGELKRKREEDSETEKDIIINTRIRNILSRLETKEDKLAALDIIDDKVVEGTGISYDIIKSYTDEHRKNIK